MASNSIITHTHTHTLTLTYSHTHSPIHTHSHSLAHTHINIYIYTHANYRYGADVEASTYDGRTAIMFAAQDGRVGTVQFLIVRTRTVRTHRTDASHAPHTRTARPAPHAPHAITYLLVNLPANIPRTWCWLVARACSCVNRRTNRRMVQTSIELMKMAIHRCIAVL